MSEDIRACCRAYAVIISSIHNCSSRQAVLQRAIQRNHLLLCNSIPPRQLRLITRGLLPLGNTISKPEYAEREKERERVRERVRERESQRETVTDSDRQRETERDSDSDRERDGDRQRETVTDRDRFEK